MLADLDGLRAIVRALHVHYDVDPELELVRGARVKVATLVRLWGVHPRGSRALPGCSKCREIFSELKRIAEFVIDDDATTADIAVEPFRPALYDSRAVPGADEIALPIRIARGDGRGDADGRDERHLKRIRARLRELAVPER